MILFFNLDVGKKLADCTIAKDEYITVIFRGCELSLVIQSVARKASSFLS